MSHQAASWGRYPPVEGQVLLDLRSRKKGLPEFSGSALPRGNGRSYGDSCLNPGGNLLLTRKMDRFIALDLDHGILRCEAGATLGEILALIVPHGWFLPVVPGTQMVTVGGAIANDVHGKNHHAAGSFGHHVLRFELLRTDCARIECVPGGADGLFEATVGGLGLTGVVMWAELRLRRVPSAVLEAESIRFNHLDDFFAISAESARGFEYTAAWIDCLASGRSLGRGHFLRSNHVSTSSVVANSKKAHRISIPLVPPVSLVNPLVLRLFNEMYYRRQLKGRRSCHVHSQSHLFPLDGIRNWNVIYGPRGFLQHQSVLPANCAREAVAEMLTQIARSGLGSFLAVLKEFGTAPPAGLLSFPRPGTTLALDFPNAGESVFRVLNALDEIVAAAGGALYPAKDARMSGAMFRQSFPKWSEFEQHVDPRFSSAFWRRVMKT